MKNLLKVTLFTTGILAGFLPAMNAQTTTTTPATPAGTAAPAHLGRRAMIRRAMIRHHIAKKLGLTADQKTQLKTARANTHAAVKAIRDNNSLTPDQKKAQIRETLKTARAQMRAVLTPDQQAKLQRIRAKLRKAHGG